MKMNKVLVKLYVPTIEEQYDIWIPLNKRIYNVIVVLVKGINDLSGGYYTPETMPVLYGKLSARPFDVNLKVMDSTIRNGTEIILM